MYKYTIRNLKNKIYLFFSFLQLDNIKTPLIHYITLSLTSRQRGNKQLYFSVLTSCIHQRSTIETHQTFRQRAVSSTIHQAPRPKTNAQVLGGLQSGHGRLRSLVTITTPIQSFEFGTKYRDCQRADASRFRQRKAGPFLGKKVCPACCSLP